MDSSDSFFKRLDRQFPALTKTQKQIGAYIRRAYRSAVFLPLAAISRETGASEASIVRFARALGYSGYSEMQSHMQEYVSESMLTTVERFRLFDRPRPEGEVLHTVIGNSVEAVRNLQNLLEPAALRECALSWQRLKKIFLAGFESTAGLAEYFAYYLSRSGFPAQVVTEKTGDLFPQAQEAGADMQVVALLLPRYSKQLLSFCRFCRSKGATLTIIADAPDHPLQGQAEFEFYVSQRRVQGMNLESHMGMLATIQMLIQEAGLSDRERTRQSLEELENYNKLFGLFQSSQDEHIK
ncbi:MAG: MurR/RpiR family transcriptional regulator [bacterium]